MIRFSRHALIAIILLLLPGCIVPGYLYDSQSNYMNFQIEPTATSNSASISELDENETRLLGDGPVDSPITIAKLDSPDIKKITITVIDAAEGIDRHFILTGNAGAIHEDQTTKLILFAVNSELTVDADSRVTATVAEDGSFAAEIEANEDVMIAGLTEDETAMSPFLILKQDTVTGHIVTITTNSNTLDSTGQISADESGNYYLTLTTSDGTQVFVRRNLDGTETQVIGSGITDPVNRMSTPTQSAVATLTDAGELGIILPSSPSSSLQDKIRHLEIVSLTSTLDSGYDTAQSKIELTTDNSGVLVSEAGENSRINYVRAQSGLVIPVITSGHYDDVKMDLSPDSSDLFVFYLHEGAYVLTRSDVNSTSIRNNWANRETLLEIIRDEIQTLESSDSGTVVFSASNNDTLELYYFNATDGLIAINDTDSDTATYTNPIISTDGGVIFACKMGDESASESNQIVYHRPGTDAAGTLNPLTTFDDFSACDDTPGSLFLDSDGFLHIYLKNSDGSLPQHALIDTNAL